jgi:hypothetical protein
LGLEEIGAAVEGGDGSHGELPERGLELRIGVLDRVEVQAIRR